MLPTVPGLTRDLLINAQIMPQEAPDQVRGNRESHA